MRRESIKALSQPKKKRSKKNCPAIPLVIEEVRTIENRTHDAVPREPPEHNGLEDDSR